MCKWYEPPSTIVSSIVHLSWVFLEMGGGGEGQATHGILTERIPPPLVQILTFQHCLKVRNLTWPPYWKPKWNYKWESSIISEVTWQNLFVEIGTQHDWSPRMEFLFLDTQGWKNYHKITIRNLVLALTEKLESNLHDITINNYLLLSYIKQADFIKCTESHFKASIRVKYNLNFTEKEYRVSSSPQVFG